jgi:hypothetical protein
MSYQTLLTHKRCKDCKKLSTIDNFYVHKKPNKQIYYASYCKRCAISRARTADGKRREKNYLRLWAYFRANPCVDCGETNPLKLSLDHRDSVTKDHDVSRIMKHNWKKIQAEIDKCDVRCHNCHAVKTHVSLNHFDTERLRNHLLRWPANKKAYEDHT